MKAVIYISSLSRGGAERVVTTLAQQLKETCDIIVVTDTVSGSEYPEAEFERINMGYIVYSNPLKRMLHKHSFIKRLKQVVIGLKPDVVISFSIESALRMKKALKGTDIKQIVTVRSNPAVDYKTSEEVKTIIRKMNHFDGFVFQTEEQRDFFGENIAAQSAVILNPIADEFLEEEKPISETNKIVATFGRLTKSKDHHTLLRAYDIAADELPDYRFIIYGDGELRDEMHEILSGLKNKEQIILFGECSDVKVRLAKTAVFVLSSKNEGLPNALMEAMASGLPVISTDCPCGGPAAIIRNGENGLLVPVGDEKAMAAAIIKLCKNPETASALGREALKIKNACAPYQIAQQWITYIDRVVKGV